MDVLAVIAATLLQFLTVLKHNFAVLMFPKSIEVSEHLLACIIFILVLHIRPPLYVTGESGKFCSNLGGQTREGLVPFGNCRKLQKDVQHAQACPSPQLLWHLSRLWHLCVYKCGVYQRLFATFSQHVPAFSVWIRWTDEVLWFQTIVVIMHAIKKK